jgi:hypothetical protein
LSRDSSVENARVIGTCEGKLYRLLERNDEALVHYEVNTSELWHRRYAHLNYQALPFLEKMVERIPELQSTHEGICRGCALGKNVKKPFSSSDNRSKEILDLIHSDVWKVRKVSHCFNKWCYNALYEDVGMKLFILYFNDDDLDWFTELKDKQVKTYNELIDAFMEKWKEKKPLDIKTINPDTKIDASPDSNKKLKEVIQAMEFIYAKKLRAMEARLAEPEACIEYSNLIEPELHSEQEREFHLEIP